jgi:hypothetical protein
MSPSRSRQITVVLVAFAVAAGSLLVAGSALAELGLFRVEQRWHNMPNPAVPTPTPPSGFSPGGAGHYQGYLNPYASKSVTPMGAPGEYYYEPALAVVEPGNPIGGAFTLPTGFIHWSGTTSITSKTGWPGYSTITYYDYYNGPGRFGPSNPYGAAATTRLVFPTTMGNPTPNTGMGKPNLPTVGGELCADGNPPPFGDPPDGCGTATFDGRYDMSRWGSVHVTPGTNRFGGTFRIFKMPDTGWWQDVFYFKPALYWGYGYYRCLDEGMFDCTKDTFMSTAGDITQDYAATWFLRNISGTGSKKYTPPYDQTGKARATTPRKVGGRWPTPDPDGNLSFIGRHINYLHLIHPWTTGFAKVVFTPGNPGEGIFTPQASGYDTTFSDADITVTRYDWNQQWNKTLSALTTTTTTYKQHLYGVDRVVSMVRPRILHAMSTPLDPTTDPIENIWTPVRLWRLKVYFLPEPAGMLLLGIGIAALLGLSRMRRR